MYKVSLYTYLLAILTCQSYAFKDETLYGLDHVYPYTHDHDDSILFEKHYREEFQPRSTTSCAGRRACSRGLLNPRDPCANIIARAEWGARDTRHANCMVNPVSIVFIHHTVMERCYTQNQCLQAMQKVQELHMDVRHWDDIGYSFVVGEDGGVYEARGYRRVGAHTLGWNNASIAIAVMGDFTDDLPNGQALQAINNVIECGIQRGKIMPDYKLYGHRDARPMFESPGKRLYPLIKTWPHYEHRIPIEKLKLQFSKIN